MTDEERPDQPGPPPEGAGEDSESIAGDDWAHSENAEQAGEKQNQEAPESDREVDLDFLLDLPLQVSVEAGRRRMPIGELLKLRRGSAIVLDKEVHEPFEVYVNGKLLGYGEVVIVNEKLGLRLTEVVDPRKRVRKLGPE